MEDGALEVYADARWNRVIDINLNGIFATARTAARHMRPRGFGRIIVTTSLAATKVEPAIGSAYMAAKAGAAHFMRSAALELAASGITVNAIAPGFFITNIGGGHAHNPDLQAAIARDIPMHRVGQPDDIKALALFLASARVVVHHRAGDRDRRRVGAGRRRLGPRYAQPHGRTAGRARRGCPRVRRGRASRPRWRLDRSPAGLVGHSDGDVIAHALTDALLGAAGLADIGALFPSEDDRYAGADSLVLLAEAYRQVREAGFVLVNADVVLVGQEPKLAPHREEMRRRLAEALGASRSRSTCVRRRPTGWASPGAGEGLAAEAVALLQRAGLTVDRFGGLRTQPPGELFSEKHLPSTKGTNVESSPPD